MCIHTRAVPGLRAQAAQLKHSDPAPLDLESEALRFKPQPCLCRFQGMWVCTGRYVPENLWRYERIEGAGHWVRVFASCLVANIELTLTLLADVHRSACCLTCSFCQGGACGLNSTGLNPAPRIYDAQPSLKLGKIVLSLA